MTSQLWLFHDAVYPPSENEVSLSSAIVTSSTLFQSVATRVYLRPLQSSPSNTGDKLRGGGPGSPPAGPHSGTLRWGSGCRCEPRQLHRLVRPPPTPAGPQGGHPRLLPATPEPPEC